MGFAALREFFNADTTGLSSNEFRVLSRLADCVHDVTGNCTPSAERLMRECGMSRSTLFRALADLEKHGWIKRVGRAATNGTGKRLSSQFILCLSAGLSDPKSHHDGTLVPTPQSPKSETLDTPQSPTPDTTKVPALTPKPIREPIEKRATLSVSGGVEKDLFGPKLNGHSIAPEDITVEEVTGGWNKLADKFGLPSVRKLNHIRQMKLRGRIADNSRDDWLEVFDNIRASPHLRGENGGWGGVSFDWLLEAENFQKILEGNYSGKKVRR
jgi:hypothetical protein